MVLQRNGENERQALEEQSGAEQCIFAVEFGKIFGGKLGKTAA